MKKVTMIVLCASVLVSVSLDAMMDIENGFLGMKRDIILKLTKIIKDDDEETMNIFGMCEEIFQWKNHRFFKKIRQRVFPKPWDVKEVNKALEEHFKPLDGECHNFHGCCAVGKSWSREFNDLILSKNLIPSEKFPWRRKMGVSFDECLDKCNSPDLALLAKGVYKRELFVCLSDRRASINVNRLQEFPYDLFLLVIADRWTAKYAKFFSKNQFRRIPIQCIEKSDILSLGVLCCQKNKLPEGHIAALDRRIGVLREQWDAAHAAGANDDIYNISLHNLGQLREKFSKI